MLIALPGMGRESAGQRIPFVLPFGIRGNIAAKAATQKKLKAIGAIPA